jgi:hypothetical protein
LKFYFDERFVILYVVYFLILPRKQKAGLRIRILLRVKSWIRIRIKSKFRSFRGSICSLGGPWTLIMKALGRKMKPWRVCRTVVADLHHHFDEDHPDSQ